MGIRLFSASDSCCTPTPRLSPNPDPSKYSLVRIGSGTKFALVELQYEGCTNFEGRKILLLGCGSISVLQHIRKKLPIDPHFSDGNSLGSSFAQPTVIARYYPNNGGWQMGMEAMRQLQAQWDKR